MSDNFVSEIRMFPFNFPPRGWALCNGQILSISQNTALFSLVGTNFGGNGTSTFGLPNLQGNYPVAFGNGAGLTPTVIGETSGSATVTLISTQMPIHTHQPAAATGNVMDPGNATFGFPSGRRGPVYYANAIGTQQQLNATALSTVGGSLPHNNLMPYLVVNFCIALQGIFPARN